MKINVDEIKFVRNKDRSVTFRLPEDNFKNLRKIDRNVSAVLRYLVEAFLLEYAEKEQGAQSWNIKQP